MDVNACRAAGINQIVDSVYPHIHNEQGLVNETRQSKKLGFTGKLLIHPKQISTIVNNLYNSYTEQDFIFAKRVVELFEEAESQGIAAIQYENQMIDHPVYKRAKEFTSKNYKNA